MSNRIRDAFMEIRAEEELKKNTLAYLQQISLKKSNSSSINKYRLMPAVAACVLFIFLSGMGVVVWRQPVSYISVDVNPSIELELNRFDRVVSWNVYNKEGAEILKDLSVQGKSYTEAIEMILQSAEMQKYLKKNGLLEFAVASAVNGKEIGLEVGIENMAVYGHYESECGVTDMATAKEAHNNNMSIGKYMVYLMLSEYDETLTIEDCRHQSMAELHDDLLGYGVSHHGHGGMNSVSEESTAPVSDSNKGNGRYGQSGHHHRH